MSPCQSSIRRLLRSVLFSAFAVIIASGPGLAQVPMRQYDATLKKMLDAVQTKAYDQFVAEGDARFKTSFTPKMFEELARQLGPKLQQGYAMTFLTTLNQQEYTVYVWKLMIKADRDDLLITLFIKEGKVSGFVAR